MLLEPFLELQSRLDKDKLFKLMLVNGACVRSNYDNSLTSINIRPQNPGRYDPTDFL